MIKYLGADFGNFLPLCCEKFVCVFVAILSPCVKNRKSSVAEMVLCWIPAYVGTIKPQYNNNSERLPTKKSMF